MERCPKRISRHGLQCLYCWALDIEQAQLDSYVREFLRRAETIGYWVNACTEHEPEMAAALLRIESVG